MGSSQYLKEKYGMGYTLEAKIIRGEDAKYLEFVEILFNKNAILQQQFSNHYIYTIPKAFVNSLSLVFDSLEKGMKKNILSFFFIKLCFIIS